MEIVTLIVNGFVTLFDQFYRIISAWGGGIILALFFGMFLIVQLYRFILQPIFTAVDRDITYGFSTRGKNKNG